jgi:hypothetical protein
MTNYRRRLPMHPLLGRHVNHDSRSRAYPVAPTATTLTAVRHAAYVGILDQGQLGSCTGNAGVGAIYRRPFSTESTSPWPYLPDEDGAVALYGEATKIDGYAGTYPPDDTGSDGLSVAKSLKAGGIVSGYLHAFTLESALLQLMSTPLITGITWYESMHRAVWPAVTSCALTSMSPRRARSVRSSAARTRGAHRGATADGGICASTIGADCSPTTAT